MYVRFIRFCSCSNAAALGFYNRPSARDPDASGGGDHYRNTFT